MEYKLIMAVSGFPSLFDPNSLTYRDLNSRSNAWRQVAETVGVLEFDCRRKWKMLRDQHRRERQREKERRDSGLGLGNYRPWRYAAVLSFLNPYVDARAAGTNGWALDPQPPHCHEDDHYGVAVGDATTTTASTSSSVESVQRKRPSSSDRDTVRLKDLKTECITSENPSAVATDDHDTVQTDQLTQSNNNTRELFEVMMQSVTSLAASLSQSHAALDQGRCTQPASLHSQRGQKAGEQVNALGPVSVSDQSDVEDIEDDLNPRWTRVSRKNSDLRLEEYVRSMEARQAQRDTTDRDVSLSVAHNDDVTLFLLSLAPAVRRLSPHKQSLVRTKMMQLLHHVEFGDTNFE